MDGIPATRRVEYIFKAMTFELADLPLETKEMLSILIRTQIEEAEQDVLDFIERKSQKLKGAASQEMQERLLKVRKRK